MTLQKAISLLTNEIAHADSFLNSIKEQPNINNPLLQKVMEAQTKKEYCYNKLQSILK